MENNLRKKTRKSLTILEKQSILKDLDNNISIYDLEKRFSIPKSTLYKIKSEKEALINTHKNITSNSKRIISESKYEIINEFMVSFISHCNNHGLPINGPLIKEISLRFANEKNLGDFKASNGWLSNFKSKNNIQYKKICGESLSADIHAANLFTENFENTVEGYIQDDIFNLDETALFWQALPDKTFIQKYKQAKGRKRDRQRVSVCLLVSMKGEKMQPLVIGRSKKPRCFKNKRLQCLSIIYDSNSSAWMTKQIFIKYMDIINTEMQKQDRKILIILDNCSSHFIESPSNIKFVFLPPKTTALIQPLDQGIIYQFKIKYKKNLMNRILFNFHETFKYKIDFNLYDAIENISVSFYSINESIIVKCFKCFHKTDNKSTGFIETEQVLIEDNEFLEVSKKLIEKGIVTESIGLKEYLQLDDYLSHNTHELSDTIYKRNLLDFDIVPKENCKSIQSIMKTLKKLKEKNAELAPELSHQLLDYEQKLLVILNKK